MKNLFKKDKKIFCISFQRTGTTSVGQFFKNFGYSVQGYNDEISARWSLNRLLGDYQSIFESPPFIKNQVFEDNPWWEGDFYKYLYHNFPDAKFVLFTRDPDKWFNSMVSHSKGKTLGNTFRHCKNYNRLEEYREKINFENIYETSVDNLLELNENHRNAYRNIYINRNWEILKFFEYYDSTRFIHLELEDKEKWSKLGDFFNIRLPNDYEVHLNKSK